MKLEGASRMIPKNLRSLVSSTAVEADRRLEY